MALVLSLSNGATTLNLQDLTNYRVMSFNPTVNGEADRTGQTIVVEIRGTTTENIGARRLHTVLERLLEKISYDAADKSGQKVKVDLAYVNKYLNVLSKNEDLSHYIL